MTRSSETPRQVICICGGYGYPQGAGSAARITLVGRALQASGMRFQVLHCGPSPTPVNTERSGIHEGIPFEYTTSLARPRNTLARLLVYTRAVIGLTRRLLRLWRERERTVVYLYVMSGPLNLFVSTLCRWLGIPVVQELCEWWPGEPGCSALTEWLYQGPMFTSSTGLLVISNAIERRARERAAVKNADLRICRLPSVVDLERFAAAHPAACAWPGGLPNFVWCGAIDGWLKDVLFLLRALARVRLHRPCQLTIIGSYSERSRAAVAKYAGEIGLSVADAGALRADGEAASGADVLLRGWVDDQTLRASYHSASALLLPLWDDDRSRTRMPNKMAEYLASGKPVITCRVGDLTDFLIDDVNACVGAPGDEREFAGKMIAVLDHPEHAQRIGAAGRQACAAHFDYRAHVPALAEFFDNCMHQQAASGRGSSRMNRLTLVVRHSFCALLALVLIASGRVRRARKRALREPVVTALYFHKPARLFLRCVRWLQRQGYTFISAAELIGFLRERKPVPPGAVWLSFDDGCRDLLREVLPVARRYRIPVTLFIPSGIVEGDGRFPWMNGGASARQALTVEEVKAIARDPQVTIGSHTVSHPVATRCTEAELGQEFSESKRVLESWTGLPVDQLSYPFGDFDERVVRAVQVAGYALAATVENAFVAPGADPYRVPRFSIADDISFLEAICNIVGVWRPAIAPLKALLGRFSGEEHPSAMPAPENLRQRSTAALRSRS